MNIRNNPPQKPKALGAKRQYIYMVTIRKHQVKDFVTVSDLTDRLTWLVTTLGRSVEFTIDTTVFEVDPKYMQLHLHCILTATSNFKYYKLTKNKGFRIHFRKVYDLTGAKGYLMKQVRNDYVQDQLIDENYFNHHYGFV